VNIAQVLAVSRVSPLLLVVEGDDSTVVERSLRELHAGSHRVRAVVRSPDDGLVRRHARAR
jgi:hypothetical protein